MSGLMQGLTVAAGAGSAVVGGVFFAFSGFVMPALKKLPDATGVRSMQAINKTATAPPLMIALFGTAALSVACGVWAARHFNQPAAPLTLGAAITYLVGGIGVTIAANVPRNEALAKLDPTAGGTATQWAHYLSSWTAWNHVRTIACLLAAVGFVIALLRTAGVER